MLAQLATAYPSIQEHGGDIIGVAPAAPYQAAHLMETSIPFELMLDRDHGLSRRLELESQTLTAFLFNVPAWWKYGLAFARNRRQGRITASHDSLPAIAVADPLGTVTYLHRGDSIADYPPLSEVLSALAALL